MTFAGCLIVDLKPEQQCVRTICTDKPQAL